MNPTHPPTELRRKIVVAALCLLAIAHVIIFSAAFPFFSVVDEQAHFDLLVRYGQLQPPTSLPHTSDKSLPYIVYFSSSEYLHTPESQPHGMFAPPPWQLPPEEATRRLADREQFWREVVVNHEASQPPLYYILAGTWWRIGQALNLTDAPLLYWLRALNALLVAGMVWLAATAARKIFPDNIFLQVAVPALVAFFPQSIFYALNNDVLSPLVFGAAFMLVLDFYEAEKPGPKLAVATGLALAAAYLTKLSNLPLLAVAGLFLGLKAFHLLRRHGLHGVLASLSLLVVCAALPMVAWMAWCQVHFGDPTGSAQKVQFLNWLPQPVSEWFHHPVFTAGGFWYFLKTNLATFWQGEALWYRKPLANPAVDSAYSFLTLGALLCALIALLVPRSGFTSSQRTALWFSFSSLAAMLAFFVLLSVKYDFQDCFYPSRALPYFTSGRLMLGLLIPFLLLFAAGLDRLLKPFQTRSKLIILLALLAFLLATEIANDLPVFSSEYNWYHM